MSNSLKVELLLPIQASDTLANNVRILSDLEKLLKLISVELEVLTKKEKIEIKELSIVSSKGILNLILDLTDDRTFTQLLSSNDNQR